MPTRLTFRNVTATESGIHIARLEIIDDQTGEVQRVVKFTPKLADFLETVEIDIEAWHKIIKLREKNQCMDKLIDTFKLFS